MFVNKWFVVVASMVVCFSCSSSKEIVYLQDVKENERLESDFEYKTVIHVDDLLSIVVSCDDTEAALPFNTPMIGLGRDVTSTNQQVAPGYLVDKEGYIDFPVLGKLRVDGISRVELSEMLKMKLAMYLKNPIVTIHFQNFKVTVLGEVRSPGSYRVTSERVSIFDALGMAGDLQINAKRKNVLIMRENGKEKTFARLDLTSANLVYSPFFYLQQNDVVYVEPSRGRIAGGNAGTFLPYVLSSVSTLVTVLALILR
ncbi:polysaccharide biosynthesis/export family protein [Butyricimonas hominis]|uniref:Polysaccharide biosynthesis/export family protein n=1 Tax=Butyricimonas hominis TaxID=2763032 RepID=A0ABR7CZV6_9BACT|nr:polysaccharide biosynthesis/export family protein [Butyricimonas hominis]MBC5621200.1 polysaccharide biosynthesis/export family protein [Butyricimonas hominis]